ncbi:hypothetical protein ACH4Q6_35965 [Streptomyces lydicus]|uniref:hypothetical protein n=1 Tax=Streptomyces lydicus TaxID=47763 RepID=UPI0037B42A39
MRSRLPPYAPRLPSAYAEAADYAHLLAVASRDEPLRPQLKIVHAETIARAASYLLPMVEQVATAGFASERFASESLHEARRAYELWQRRLTERRRDYSYQECRPSKVFRSGMSRL